MMMLKTFYRPLTLIGFQLCGKTTLGKSLAKALKYEFIDVDQLIERSHPGLSCRTIHATFGNDYFRNLEEQAIASLCFDHPFILATGGGSLLKETTQTLLKEKTTILYLKTSPHILKERIWQRLALPSYLSLVNPEEDFERIYRERVAVYEKYANHTILMDELDIQAATKAIIGGE